ncbi:MAG: HEAT repeat domain-containing protein [Planctomycetes bacterium]|nr:HEAT repeat domain-containing protein [Planctomycetota bacterium]MBI3834643.1 HEAT repeat domain-containing protein [Planctomycetota bacterium]
MARILIGVTIAGILASAFLTACADDLPTDFSDRAGPAIPISKLPSNVITPDGQLTLFADFNDHRRGGIVLYLVNRTPYWIGFAAQDGDLFIKLEVLSGNGLWERAQDHYYSWCGNSYDQYPSLRPSEFFRFLGIYPKSGAPSMLRYRAYVDHVFIASAGPPVPDRFRGHQTGKIPIELISNVGLGRVYRGAVEKAKSDKMGIQHANFRALRDASLRGRVDAITQLERYPSEETAILLTSLLGHDNESVRQAALRTLARTGLKCPMAETQYQKLLHDGDVGIRAAAIMQLVDRPPSPDVVREMAGLLEQSDSNLRIAAIVVLAHEGKDYLEARRLIRNHTDDPDERIQRLQKIYSEKIYSCPDSDRGTSIN